MLDNRIISNKLLRLFKPKLHSIIRVATPHAMISRNRMQSLHRLLYRIDRDGIPGDVVETGVARGGSSILIGSFIFDSPIPRELWLYDAFEILEPACAQFDDVHRLLFETFSFDPARVHLIKGLFDDSLPEYPDRPIALLHIDAGFYEPVKSCIDHLYDRVETGGWVVFDNYGVDEGCRKAVDELLERESKTNSLQRFSHTQAYFQK